MSTALLFQIGLITLMDSNEAPDQYLGWIGIILFTVIPIMFVIGVSVFFGRKTKIAHDMDIANITGIGIMDRKVYDEMTDAQVADRVKNQLEKIKNMDKKEMANFHIPKEIKHLNLGGKAIRKPDENLPKEIKWGENIKR